MFYLNSYQARLPFVYALRDAFGLKDVWEDTKDTFKGRGVSYQAYEPAEGTLHYGFGRQKRIRAGLRYSKGGKAKYWIPVPGDETRIRIESNPIAALKKRVDERLAQRQGYAPLLPKQAARVVHDDPEAGPSSAGYSSDSDDSDAPSLGFSSVDEDEDNLYERARRIGYAGFPNVDVSREAKERKRREEEDGILAGRWTKQRPGLSRGRTDSSSAGSRPGKGKAKETRRAVYGACACISSGLVWLVLTIGADGDNVATPRSVRRGQEHGAIPDADGAGYDGDAERPDAWRADQNAHAEDRLTWTKKSTSDGKTLKAPKSAPLLRRHSSAKNPFTLGDVDDDDDKSTRSGVATPSDRPLPSDARDLVVDDEVLAEEARVRGRVRGEPQTKAPAHVYVHNDPQTQEPAEVEEVYLAVNGEMKEPRQGPSGSNTASALPENQIPGSQLLEQLQRVDESAAVITPVEAPYDGDNPWA